MNIGTVIFSIYMLHTMLVIIFTFKIFKRASIISSVWDIFYDLTGLYKKMLTIKWDKSEFPTIDSNNFMLRFVLFSQKRKYYIFFAAVILINTYK